MILMSAISAKHSQSTLLSLSALLCTCLAFGCFSPTSESSGLPSLAPSSNTVSLLACAGPDQFVRRASQVQLNANCSRIINLDQQHHYLWSQLAGPSVSLQAPINEQTLFLAPLTATNLDFSMSLQAARMQSQDSSKIFVLDANADPYPLATPPLALGQGDILLDDGQVSVILDASRSIIFSGEMQSVRWTQILGPQSQLVDADKLKCTATFSQPPDLAVFSIELQSSNGLWSAPEFIVVRSRSDNYQRPGDASLHAPSYAQVGEIVRLQLSPLDDEDPDIIQQLSQSWGDSINLEHSGENELTFTAPRRPQILIFRLDRSRLGIRSAPAISVIKVSPGLGNHSPVANAGQDRTVRPGQGLVLDGSRSQDPDRDPITEYRWTQVAGPSMPLDCSNERCLTNSPEQSGVAVFFLVVSDGVAESEPDVLAITIDPNAENQAPEAHAGGERWGQPGQEITLDGHDSFDPDSGHIERWTWQQVEDDAPRAIVINGLSASRLTVMLPDETSELSFRLTVCDQDQACDTDTMTVHVENAGPYVDIARGSAQGRGSVAAPYQDLVQALLWSQRFGVNELRLTSGNYALSDSLVLPPGFLLRGGFYYDGDHYAWSAEQRSHIIVPGLSAISLSSGAALKDLDISASTASASTDERQLIVLQANNLLQNIHAIGPTNARLSHTVLLQAAASAQIISCDLQGGDAIETSSVITQQHGSSVELSDTQLLLGRAERSVGLQMEDAELRASDLSVKNQINSSGQTRTGIDLLRGQASFTRLDVDLSATTISDTPKHVRGLLCQSCSVSVDANSNMTGAGALETGGSSWGMDLQQPEDAQISGHISGGTGESAERYTALRLQGGQATLLNASLVASENAGESALGLGLYAENARLIVQNSEIQALSQQRAIGLALCDMPNPQLDFSQIEVAATIATGISDGREPYLEQNCPGSSQIQLGIQQKIQVLGTSDCQGILLRGSDTVDLHIGQILLNGVYQSQALTLQDCGSVSIHDGQMHVVSALHGGLSRGISCTHTDPAQTQLQLDRISSFSQGEEAVGILAPHCNISLTNVFMSVDAEHRARCLDAGANITINNSDLIAKADDATILHDASNSHISSLRNSLLWIQANSGSVFYSSQDTEQLESLHDLVILRQGLPLYSQSDQADIEDSATLISLRPTFYRLHEIAAAELLKLDASGHITSATSVLVDAAEANNAAPDDFDGELRPMGSAPDIGADEAY